LNNFVNKIIENMSAIAENNAVRPLNLTEGAVKQLRSIVQEQNIPAQYGLRVGVKGGGCSGFSYVLGFDEPKDGDDVLTINGMRVLMQKSHAIYLLGMEIDFLEGLNNRGFSFSNPNAKETCGCGTSFAA
jgi:iron-sulfur cluster assembly protein